MKRIKIFLGSALLILILSGCQILYPDTASIIATEVALAVDAKVDELKQAVEVTAPIAEDAQTAPTPYPTYTPYPSPVAQTFSTYGSSYLIGTPGGCLNAAFISEAVPDNTVFPAGDGFIKTWTIQNTGYCTWNKNYHLVLLSGDAMGGDTYTPLTESVSPGQTVKISANLTAPSSPGTYRGEWRVQSDLGVNFARFWVQIIVK
jgi:hypothetical protein